MPGEHELRGVLAALQTPFNSDGSIEEGLYRENARYLARCGAQGVFCLGSSAEFFSLSLEEHFRLTELFVDEVGNQAMKVVGCLATSLGEIIAKARRAQDCGADAIFTAPPFVQPLSRQERLLAMRQIAESCPSIGIIHYNEDLTRNGRLSADEYAELANIENFWGSKQGDPSFMDWMELHRLSPTLTHLVLDNLLVPAMMLGGRGCFSMLVCLSPRYILAMYEACRQQNWSEALRMQHECNRFFQEVYLPLYQKGYSDPVIDKALMNVFGIVPGGAPRPPLLPVPTEVQRKVRQQVEADFAYLL